MGRKLPPVRPWRQPGEVAASPVWLYNMLKILLFRMPHTVMNAARTTCCMEEAKAPLASVPWGPFKPWLQRRQRQLPATAGVPGGADGGASCGTLVGPGGDAGLSGEGLNAVVCLRLRLLAPGGRESGAGRITELLLGSAAARKGSGLCHSAPATVQQGTKLQPVCDLVDGSADSANIAHRPLLNPGNQRRKEISDYISLRQTSAWILC